MTGPILILCFFAGGYIPNGIPGKVVVYYNKAANDHGPEIEFDVPIVNDRLRGKYSVTLE